MNWLLVAASFVAGTSTTLVILVWLKARHTRQQIRQALAHWEKS